MLSGLNHITIAVSELQRSFHFYKDVLDFSPVALWKQGAYLSLNDLWLCLALGPSKPAQDYSHLAFSVDAVSLQSYRQKLEAVDISWWKTNSSEGDSLYFLDPDGHKLELHVGDLESRVQSIRREPYEDLELF